MGENLGGSACCVAYTSAITNAAVPAVVMTLVAPVMTPCGFGGVPFPTVNALASSWSLASENSLPISCAKPG